MENSSNLLLESHQTEHSLACIKSQSSPASLSSGDGVADPFMSPGCLFLAPFPHPGLETEQRQGYHPPSIFPFSASSAPPPPTSQCGFFRRSSQSSSFPTNYYRAHLAMQPSAMEAGGPGTVG